MTISAVAGAMAIRLLTYLVFMLMFFMLFFISVFSQEVNANIVVLSIVGFMVGMFATLHEFFLGNEDEFVEE